MKTLTVPATPDLSGASMEAVLVDAHVHLHPVFRTDRFLSAARRNLSRAARRAGLDPSLPACLLLAEVAGCDRFGELAARGDLDGGWRAERLAEDASLLARGPAGEELFIIAGRQVRARGGLEVLSLLSRIPVPDGLPFPEALREARAAGGVAVAPWGFGKWTLRRGEAVRQAVERSGGGLLLGDNGGRPAWGRSPALFRRAAERGIPVLPGSDPLPFRWEESRAGRYGFVLPGRLDRQRPAAWLRESLLELRSVPRTIGRREALGRFLLHQALMQWVSRKRAGKGRG